MSAGVDAYVAVVDALSGPDAVQRLVASFIKQVPTTDAMGPLAKAIINPTCLSPPG